MKDFYTVSQYAKLVGKDPSHIRRKLIEGTIKGEKLGVQWIIPVDTVYPEDRRVKSGNYRNWRKRKDIRNSNKELMKRLIDMCADFERIYGSDLEKVVLYGSYARGEQNDESDVDIALILNDTTDENKHNAMSDIVVDYELEQGKTLSVIRIEYVQYRQWNSVLPFYMNIEKEGIVLWKAA